MSCQQTPLSFSRTTINPSKIVQGIPRRRRKLLPDLEDDVLESYEEHHVADVLCAELFGMDADDERFDAKTTVLIENVTRHIDEEEDYWLRKVREGLGREQLQELGARMNDMREKAPRQPVQPSALKKAVEAIAD